MDVTEHGDVTQSRLTALADPVRRRLYEYVIGRHAPVRRDEAALSVGVSRTLAAYHLDRLAEAGLLSTRYARPPGQSGPGAGRPAKQYVATPDEVSITVPPRSYDLLAGLLADAVAADPTSRVTAAVMAAAEREGRRAADGADLLKTLQDVGYKPVINQTGDIEMLNCPFHRIAKQHTGLVCGLNLALLRGVSAASGLDPDRAELAPSPDRCCVLIRAALP